MAPIIRVAIADDHPLFRKGLKDFLVAAGGIDVVIEASHGHELLEKLEKVKVSPDVCLMDISMPIMNGYETTLKLRRKWNKLKVLAISMYDHEFNITQMIKNGAVGYLLKSCDPIKVIEAVRSVYENGYYYSEVFDQKMQGSLHNDVKFRQTITSMELKFLNLICSDLTYKDIAKVLSVSHRTVDNYRDSLFAKLRLKSRVSLVLFAVYTGIVDVRNIPAEL